LTAALPAQFGSTLLDHDGVHPQRVGVVILAGARVPALPPAADLIIMTIWSL